MTPGLFQNPARSGAVPRPSIHGLDDTDPMPFGKHKGQPMQDVPVGYLHWLWESGLRNDRSTPVAQYIRRTLDALKIENPDLIWD
jgi:uncharacterized protein (DUF3820 family)